MSSSSESAPQHFTCPLTLELMSHPIQHKVTKHNFERGAIMEWIYFGKATCPLTRMKLHPTDFEANADLEEEINQWKKDHNITVCCDEESDCDCSEEFKPSEPASNLRALMNLRKKVLQSRDDRVQKTMMRARCA